MPKTKPEPAKTSGIRRPAWWLIALLYPICWLVAKLLIHWHKHVDPAVKALKGPVVCVGTHTFAGDVLLMELAMLPRRPLNIVCGRDVFSWKPVKPIRRAAGLIPINQCAVDVSSIRTMIKAGKEGRSLALFPEGKISIDGRPLPNLNRSNAKFLKMLGMNVVFFHNNGGYSTRPRWFKAVKRGRVDQHVRLLFTAEELRAMSVDAVYARLQEAFSFNDNAWVEEKGYRYKSKNPAKGLHYILYRCPNCGTEYEMQSEGDRLACTRCGYAVRFSPTGKLTAEQGKTYYDRLDKWYDYEIALIHEQVQDPDFHVEYDVVWEECDENFNYVEAGDGVLFLNRDVIGFRGAYYPETEGGARRPVLREVDLGTINTVVQKPREAIDLTIGNQVNRFYFKEGKYSAKVNLYVQELHALKIGADQPAAH